MKKILIVIMSLLMVFFCFGCNGVYDPIIRPNKPDDDITGPGKDPDTSVETESFKVTLQCNGVQLFPKYIPGNPAKARWTSFDGLSVVEAEFDNETGVAEAKGLDGDYYVTIWNIEEAFKDAPYEYTYDANSYTADNDNRNTVIELLKILDTTHSTGSHIYDNIKNVGETGTYRTIIDSEWNGAFAAAPNAKYEGIVFYQYIPNKPGRYSVQSLVDLTDNEVNPILEYYTGNPQFKVWDKRIDTGGKSSTFSKNFRFDVSLSEDRVGLDLWGFGIRAENRSKNYPIVIDFTIKYEGAFIEESDDDDKYEEIIAEGPFQNDSTVSNEAAKGRFVYNYKDGLVTNGLCKGDRFRLDSRDGFYHLYDATKYAGNDGYGPILFAKITQNCEVVLQDKLNSNPDEDEGFFCEKGKSLAMKVRVESGNKNYWTFLETYQKICEETNKTYGLHAVNEELKQFLQDFADSSGYFADGTGLAERAGMFSTEENMWLFACGYFQY